FNAALALGVDAANLVADADSVSFCLSKSLSAPVGSLIVGTREFIGRARRARKMLGGGMRQAGVIAAAGLLAALPGVAVDLATVQTNMVRFSVEPSGLEAAEFVARLRARGVLCGARDRWTIRMVTHRHISAADVDAAAQAVAAVAAENFATVD